MTRKHTSFQVSSLTPNQVFVFGSNSTGFHGGGAAGTAFRYYPKGNWRHDKQFTAAMNPFATAAQKVGKWAVFGVARGFQKGVEGKSYAIETIVRPGQKCSTSRREIYVQLRELTEFARQKEDLEFLVVPLGCGLAGWSTSEMQEVFAWWCKKDNPPDNIILPEQFEYRK